MARLDLDGSPESERKALLLVMELQARHDFIRQLTRTINAARLDSAKG